MKFLLDRSVNLFKVCSSYTRPYVRCSPRILLAFHGTRFFHIQSATTNPGSVSADDGISSSSNSREEDGSSSESDLDEELIVKGIFKNEHYIPLTLLQKSLLIVGSGLSSFFDPTRAESIATFGEVTAEIRLDSIYKTMLNDSEGAKILQDKPRINSKTIDLDYLATLPEGTFGCAYIEFLKKNNVTPDSRLPVKFIQDPELAYVMQRYREVHDLIHTVTGMPTNMLGEVVVKWIEGIQTGLPMCVTGGIFGATRLKPKQRAKYLNNHLDWAIRVGLNSKPLLNIYYEQRWTDSLYELRNHISPLLNNPPS